MRDTCDITLVYIPDERGQSVASALRVAKEQSAKAGG